MTGHRVNIASTIMAHAMLLACRSGTDAAHQKTGAGLDSETTPSGSSDQVDAGSTDRVVDGGLESACLASISGEVLRDGKIGMEAVVIPCIGLRCFTPVVTDPDGRLLWEYPVSDDERCGRHDFSAEPLHLEITALENPEDFASYAFVAHPTQADISDEGDGDFDLRVGTLSLFALPEESATFAPEAGASVSLFGLSFELPAGGIVKRVVDEDVAIDHPQQIRVFKAPLDTWDPPFTERPLEALYFIAPRWAKLAGSGAVLSIEPPSDWHEGDEGVLRLLGGYTSNFGDNAVRDRSAYIYRDADGMCRNADDTDNLDRVEDGMLADCGPVSVTGGRLITPRVPRFTWIGISK